MAKPSNQRLSVPVTLNLRPTTVNTLTATVTTISPADALASQAEQMLEAFADGGMMLKVEDVMEVAANVGKQIESSRDVVRATEGRASKKDGQVFISGVIDPAHVEAVQEAADMSGMTLDEHLSEVFFTAVENGWLHESQAPGKRRVFTPEQEAWLTKELGQDKFTVGEIIQHIKSLKRAAKKSEELEPAGMA
jgi:hypothetical protein